MKLLDLYPSKGTFLPGESIGLIVEVEVPEPIEAKLQLNLLHLKDKIGTYEFILLLDKDFTQKPLKLSLPSNTPTGYGVEAILYTQDNQIAGKTSTAFDVMHSWTDYPRYGFLTDFSPQRSDVEDTIHWLSHFHINGLQFYDWQFRHNQLLPPVETYRDPLGRLLSLDTIRQFIHAAHRYGIAAMPYLTIYAASLEFWSVHPTWHLVDENMQPILFEDFLGIMDPSPGSPWTNHLLQDCGKVLSELDFDGLHIDQYGDPKVGYRVTGEEVDIAEAFRSFILTTKQRFSESSLTFNAVGNWPMDVLATAPLDFNYIEIWPSTPYYHNLRQIIQDSRLKSGNKPVVIALYLSAERINNIRLVDAITFACGSCRIELGETDRLLTDPYFPKHQELPSNLAGILRRYYDFAVRYSTFIGPEASDLESMDLSLPGDIWVIGRQTQGWLIFQLINMNGLGDARWEEAHPAPQAMNNFYVEITSSEKIHAVWWATPDLDDLSLSPSEWHAEGNRIFIKIPCLEFWTLIAIQIDKLE
jgi:dextranase